MHCSKSWDTTENKREKVLFPRSLDSHGRETQFTLKKKKKQIVLTTRKKVRQRKGIESEESTIFKKVVRAGHPGEVTLEAWQKWEGALWISEGRTFLMEQHQGQVLKQKPAQLIWVTAGRPGWLDNGEFWRERQEKEGGGDPGGRARRPWGLCWGL